MSRPMFDRRAAAHRAIDAWFDLHDAKLNVEQAAEAERYSRMRKREDAKAGSSAISHLDLAHTERHWPALSVFDVWRLVVRGSDLIAGSCAAGFELRHGLNSARESQ